jgi:hypothetical protein
VYRCVDNGEGLSFDSLPLQSQHMLEDTGQNEDLESKSPEE